MAWIAPNYKKMVIEDYRKLPGVSIPNWNQRVPQREQPPCLRRKRLKTPRLRSFWLNLYRLERRNTCDL